MPLICFADDEIVAEAALPPLLSTPPPPLPMTPFYDDKEGLFSLNIPKAFYVLRRKVSYTLLRKVQKLT